MSIGGPGQPPVGDHSIEGMTANERLCHFGLLERFDRAAKSKDLAALVNLLVQAKFSPEQATHTARSLWADPKRYGY